MIIARTNKVHLALALLAAAVIIFIYFPALRWMVNSWMSSDYYSHGFIVPFVSAFFIWTRRSYLKERKPSMSGALWLVLAIGLYAASMLLQMRLLGIISLLCVIYGLVFIIWGIETFKALIFPLAFLLFMVPFWFMQNIAYQLQYLSVHWSAWITEGLGLPIKTAGTEIFLGEKASFTVGVVCSGINTLVALLALAAVFGFVLHGGIKKRWGIFILAIPIAIIANILRISSIILVAHFHDVETATGWYHDISSPVFFFIAFGVLILIARALKLKLNYGMFGRQ